MTKNQSLADIAAASLEKLTGFYRKLRPDLVMVQGDTTTATAAALAAFYLKIPVAHVEAGLRSFNLGHPFPEELNRILADRISSLHFAPTKRSRENLLREGFPPKTITVTGNTVVDALKWIAGQNLGFSDPTLRKFFTSNFKLRTSHLILLTAHRRENFGRPLEEICKAVIKIIRAHPEVFVVYPVHLNPNVQRTVRHYLHGIARVALMNPVSYIDLIELIRRSHLILTDSGGIQEEAPAFGKPVIVLRRVTERPEAVEAGCSRLVGDIESSRIFKITHKLLSDPREYKKMAKVANPFGDGKASLRIVRATKRFFKERL